MIAGPLGRFLRRVGLRAGLDRGSRLRLATLGIGAFVLAVACVAVVAAGATSAGRDARMLHMLPTGVDASSPARSYYLYGAVGIAGEEPVTVIAIAPLGPHSPLPPGVPSWPAPGQAVLSPQLRADLGPAGRDRYGTDVGTIGPSGLETPTDRRVYLRPTATAQRLGHLDVVAGYGHLPHRVGGPGVAFADAPATSKVVWLLIGSMILPGFVLLLLGARMGSRERDRRTELLDALGARRRDQAIFNLGESVVPLAAGTGAAAIVAAYWLWRGIDLPWLGPVTPAADLRAAAVALLLALLMVVLVLAVVALVAPTRVRRRRGARPMTPIDRVPLKGAMAAVVAAALTFWLPLALSSPYLKLVSYLAGLLVFAVFVPSLLGALAGGVGKYAATLAARRGRAGIMVAGRQLEARPVRTSRLVAGLVLAVLAVGQVQLFVTALSAQYVQELATKRLLGESVLVADGKASNRAVTAFRAALPSDVGSAWVAYGGRVTGDCASLRLLDLPCSHHAVRLAYPSQSPRTRAVMTWWVGRNGSVTAAAQRQAGRKPPGGQLMLLSRDRADLPREQLQRLGYRFGSGGLELQRPGEEWLLGGVIARDQGRWVEVMGIAGVVLFALAAGLSLTSDFSAGARELAPLTVLTGDARVFRAASVARLMVPLLAAGALGAVAYLVLPLGLASADSPMQPSGWLASGCVLGALVVGVASSWVGARTADAAAQRWTP